MQNIRINGRDININLINALADHCMAAKCEMHDSVELNVNDARKHAQAGDLGYAAGSIERAARYAFGALSREYHEICDCLGCEEAVGTVWRPVVFSDEVIDAQGKISRI